MYELVLNKIKPSLFIVRGDDLPNPNNYRHSKNCNIVTFPDSANTDELINYLISLDDEYIIGIGNMVGWGEEFVLNLNRVKIND